VRSSADRRSRLRPEPPLRNRIPAPRNSSRRGRRGRARECVDSWGDLDSPQSILCLRWAGRAFVGTAQIAVPCHHKTNPRGSVPWEGMGSPR
jgi:hypothetical protein